MPRTVYTYLAKVEMNIFHISIAIFRKEYMLNYTETTLPHPFMKGCSFMAFKMFRSGIRVSKEEFSLQNGWNFSSIFDYLKLSQKEPFLWKCALCCCTHTQLVANTIPTLPCVLSHSISANPTPLNLLPLI